MAIRSSDDQTGGLDLNFNPITSGIALARAGHHYFWPKGQSKPTGDPAAWSRWHNELSPLRASEPLSSEALADPTIGRFAKSEANLSDAILDPLYTPNPTLDPANPRLSSYAAGPSAASTARSPYTHGPSTLESGAMLEQLRRMFGLDRSDSEQIGPPTIDELRERFENQARERPRGFSLSEKLEMLRHTLRGGRDQDVVPPYMSNDDMDQTKPKGPVKIPRRFRPRPSRPGRYKHKPHTPERV